MERSKELQEKIDIMLDLKYQYHVACCSNNYVARDWIIQASMLLNKEIAELQEAEDEVIK